MSLLLGCAGVGSRGIDSVVGADGDLDPARVSAFIAWAAPAIRDYPPHFRDEQHREQVTAATQRIVKDLNATDLSTVEDQKLLTDVAFIFAMAHNLDMDTATKAKATFERAIALDPNDRRTNYLFGMFLTSTRVYHHAGLPYLEKAYALGEEDALFTLGLLWAERGEKEKGVEALEQYAREHPAEAERTRRMIRGIEDGTLKFRQN